MNIERRFFALANTDEPKKYLRIEHRSGSDGLGAKPWFVGYAARFGVDSLDGAVGEFTERIRPGAFRKVVEKSMCRALWNHNDDYPLAKYPNNLILAEDEIGLRFECPVSRAQYAIDLQHNIEDGIVEGNSFSFVCQKDSWHVDERGRHIRTIEEVGQLWDVGPVTYPAYGDGGLEVARRSFKAHVAEVEKIIEPRNDPRRAQYRERAANLRGWLKANGVRV